MLGRASVVKSVRWTEALSVPTNESPRPPLTAPGGLKILIHETRIYVTPFQFCLRKRNGSKGRCFQTISYGEMLPSAAEGRLQARPGHTKAAVGLANHRTRTS